MKTPGSLFLASISVTGKPYVQCCILEFWHLFSSDHCQKALQLASIPSRAINFASSINAYMERLIEICTSCTSNCCFYL